MNDPRLQVHPPQLMVSLIACSYCLAVRTPCSAAWNAPGKPKRQSEPDWHEGFLTGCLNICLVKVLLDYWFCLSKGWLIRMKTSITWVPQVFGNTTGISSWGVLDKLSFTWWRWPEIRQIWNKCELLTHTHFCKFLWLHTEEFRKLTMLKHA